MLKPALLALGQLDDPVFLGVVLRSLAWAVLAFGALLYGAFWVLHHAVAEAGWSGWWAWAAGLAGSAGAALAAFWLYLPVASAIGCLYVDRVAAAVERRHYPDVPPRRGAAIAAQVADALWTGLWVLLFTLAALLLAIILPGPGVLLGWLIAAWAIGRALFGAVAMRRMSRRDAAVLARRHRTAIIAQGAILAAAGFVPLLNLLVPVLGTAAMVHLLHRVARPRG
jgi:CysZ protein